MFGITTLIKRIVRTADKTFGIVEMVVDAGYNEGQLQTELFNMESKARREEKLAEVNARIAKRKGRKTTKKKSKSKSKEKKA